MQYNGLYDALVSTLHSILYKLNKEIKRVYSNYKGKQDANPTSEQLIEYKCDNNEKGMRTKAKFSGVNTVHHILSKKYPK